MAASGHRGGQGGRVGVDLLARALLRHRHEEAVLVGAVEGPERHAGQDLVLEQALHHALGRLGQLERELLEEGRAELELHPGDLAERLRRVVRLGRGELARLAQADLAHDGHVDRRHEGAERHVGADVRGRFLAADVLFARLQGEDEAALAVEVHRGADQAAGHPTHQLLLDCEDTTMSAPRAPGGARRARFTGSATTTRRAPAAWAISPAAFTSSKQPKKFGYWITTAAVCALTALRSASRSVTPSASAAERSRRPGPST